MAVLLLCVGKLKENWQKDACADYLKRLSRFGKFEIRETPDFPEPEKSSPALAEKVKEKEGKAMLACLRPEDRLVALDMRGAAPDSPALAGMLARWQESGRRTVLAVGGSLGLSKDVLARAEERVSFSNLTFPHPLMRVILLEQLYRAAKINAGERYHK